MMMMILASIAPSHKYKLLNTMQMKWILAIFWFSVDFITKYPLNLPMRSCCGVAGVWLRRRSCCPRSRSPSRGSLRPRSRTWCPPARSSSPSLSAWWVSSWAHCLAPHHGCMMCVCMCALRFDLSANSAQCVGCVAKCVMLDVVSARVGPLLTPHWWRRAPLLSSQPPAAAARHMDTPATRGHGATCASTLNTLILIHLSYRLIQHHCFNVEDGRDWKAILHQINIYISRG